MTTPKEEIIEIEINKTIFKKAIKAHKEFAPLFLKIDKKGR